jgi:hypothetical protein
VLEDAAARSGGTPLTNEFVDTTGLAELGPDLLAAAARAGHSTERGWTAASARTRTGCASTGLR